MRYEKIQLDEQAYLEAYIADATVEYTRKAILVIPGGGYGAVCADREGEPIALAFIPHGFNAFVLHYSVGEGAVYPLHLVQASMAMKHIRDHAVEYGIDKEQVFTVGFSAGGHLAGSLAVLWNRKEIYEQVDMPYGYNKPTGAMLVYPVVTASKPYAHEGSFLNLYGVDAITEEICQQGSLEQNVTAEASPLYLVHAADDTLVPVENSLMLAAAYSKEKIPFELHIYPKGEHGFAVGNKITWNGKEIHMAAGLKDWIPNAARWTETMSQ